MSDPDVNIRMRYFDRQFLRAKDFQVEQQYHLDRHRRHNRLMHTPGVAKQGDLEVTGRIGENILTVAEGTAIDVEGCEIVLPKKREHTIPPEQAPGTYEFVVRYDEMEDESSTSTDPGVDGKTRIRENALFELLTPDNVRDPMLRLARIEVEPAGKLKSDPTSTRTFAGVVVGASTEFATVTAETFALKADGIDISKRPDLSCNALGDIRFRTTPLTNGAREDTLVITSTGFVKSPKWNVQQVYGNERGNADTGPNGQICTPRKFETGGGTLVIFASGSGAATAAIGSTTIGMELFLDNTDRGHVEISVTDDGPHKPFMTSGLVLHQIGVGEHELTLKTNANTRVSNQDFFSVTILELPFE